jgi:putative transposase
VSAQLVAAGYPVGLICQILGLARSSYYHAPAPAGADEQATKAALEQVAAEWPTYGYRRLTGQLARDHQAVNSKRVRRLMAEMGLQAQKPRKKMATTDSRHAFPRYPNQVADLTIERPDQVWVGDITYIRLRGGFVYLAVLMDVFTRQLRGWELARSLDQGLTLTALERALAVSQPEIHHSDQGVQYAATAYVARLQAAGVQLSMAAVGHPEENPYAERLIRTIKEEEVYLSEYQDFTDAYAQIGPFLDDVYNRKRIHSALGYRTPAEFAARWGRGGGADPGRPPPPGKQKPPPRF